MKRRGDFNPENSNQHAHEPSVDAYFDRELAPDSIESLLDSLNQSRSSKKQFDDTQEMLDGLRAPVAVPDISGKILGEVGDRRGWLSNKQRTFVIAGRLATAACLLLIVTGLLIARRQNPETFRVAEQTGPVSEIVKASGTEAGAGIRAISDGLRSIEIRSESAVSKAAISVSICDSLCKENRRVVTVHADQDYSVPLSPGVGQWLSAGSGKAVIMVTRGASQDAAPTIYQSSFDSWLIAPERGDVLPSFDATTSRGTRLINAADWTAMRDQGR